MNAVDKLRRQQNDNSKYIDKNGNFKSPNTLDNRILTNEDREEAANLLFDKKKESAKEKALRKLLKEKESFNKLPRWQQMLADLELKFNSKK
jgi:hypothetical protein